MKLVRRDPNTSVADGKMQANQIVSFLTFKHHLTRRLCFCSQCYTQNDLSALREFNRVVHQIQQNLPQTVGIQMNAFRSISFNQVSKIKLFAINNGGDKVQ